MDVGIVAVPYHLGHYSVGMGAGPDRLLDAGLADALREHAHQVEVSHVELEPQSNEVAALFAMAGLVSTTVAEAAKRGAFPLVLSGNCFCALGVVAGLGDEVGVVWLDAHPDFNTADGTTSGFQDGMGLAILTGTGWNALRETIPGFRVVPERHVLHVGARDIAPGEAERLDGSQVEWIATGDAPERLGLAAAELARSVPGVYLHLDLDVLDPSEGRANEYAAPDGLTASQVSAAATTLAGAVPVRAASVTAYDPALDPSGSFAETAVGLAVGLVDAAAIAAPEQVRS
jgi:arginase